ncbi:YciI family protein [Mycolicibacterium chlorophenolicum]|uniref:YciI-like protein n=1 Tax=Mycolicibacterium chlorophenolicum TaxID=37916 RepID=A0A0J6WMD5_9MYCO|nr:YciI family protein [Mycolicibacterium chlorophenolicum]KMO83759.1 YciI-like protein [Mycolicibacterium chlorophenolicum]
MSSSDPNAKARPDERHAGAQKVYFACFTDLVETSRPEDIEGAVPEHKQWLADMEAAKKIFVAGPFLDENYSYSATGLIVFRAETAAEAHALAMQDPMHALGFRTFRIVPWQLNEGTMQIEINFLKGVFGFS